MTRYFFLVGLCLCLGTVLAFDEVTFRVRKEPDEFHSIDDVAFDELHKQNRGMVILYTDRYECQECFAVRERMNVFAKEFMETFPVDPNFFVLDCSQYPHTCRKKLVNRILPAIDFVIHRHVHHYKGDFSTNSLKKAVERHFSRNRLVPFRLTAYLEKLALARKRNRMVTVFNHSINGTHSGYLAGLSRLEHEDYFFTCNEDPDCLALFADRPNDNLMFAYNKRVEFHHLTRHETFNDLYFAYRDFKTPFFVPFGEDFRRSVMQEKQATAVYLVAAQDAKTKADVTYFRKEVRRHFTRLRHSVVDVTELNDAEKALLTEFLESVGLVDYGFPILFIVEKDPKKNALRKFFVTRDHWKHDTLHHTIEAWHFGQLDVWKKSQHRFDSKRESVRVISLETFKTVVTIGANDKAVLLHHTLEQDPKSMAVFRQFNALAEKGHIQGLDFLMMDLDKNDPYIEVARVPCVQIYLRDQYDAPVLYEGMNGDFSGLEKILTKRNLWRKVAKPAKSASDDDEDSLDEL